MLAKRLVDDGGAAPDTSHDHKSSYRGALIISVSALDGFAPPGYAFCIARVAELADALALGASAFGRAGSSPALRS